MIEFGDGDDLLDKKKKKKIQSMKERMKERKKREPLCTGGGNANWCSHYGKQYGGSSKN